MSKQIPKLTDRQLRNFWLKIGKRGPDDCWEWLASKNHVGYGRLQLHPAGLFYATRVMYFLATGKQPGPLCACHTCDNRGCVNPAHSFLGTHTDNMRDMVAKGRGREYEGEGNGNAKLTEKQVLEIRVANGTQGVIAAKYGVSSVLVSHIRSRRCWKHI